MAGNKPIPKSQEELSIKVAIPHKNPDTGVEINPGPRVNTAKDRANQRSIKDDNVCLLYTSPSPRDVEESRMPSSA